MQTRHRGETERAPTSQPRASGDVARGVNVGDGERMVSVLAGAATAIWGLARGGIGGVGLALLGGGLLYRGFSGFCNLYGALGIDRSRRPGASGTVRGNLGVKIERSIEVRAPADRLFATWRDFRNLPSVMSNVEAVQLLSPTRSRWMVMGPAGTKVEWEAEIINEVPNQLIAWKTTAGAVVDHAGSVNFEPAGSGATTVKVSLQYDPVGGELAHAAAALVGTDPGRQIERDLASFKDAVESGRLAG